jgi:large subunit ribosomal protein L23
MAKSIIVKPHITEKTNLLAEDHTQNVYTFIVNLKANKVEIKKAVEKRFDVEVVSVNTTIRPGKRKSRVLKGRRIAGITSPRKVAYVKVAEGNMIEDFFGAAEMETVEEAEA